MTKTKTKNINIESSFEKIRKFVLRKYKNNLAAILVFGSANTKYFKPGKSDIDTIIILKRKNKLDFKKEEKSLIKALKKENFRTQYFHSIKSIKEYIRRRISWSTYITLISKKVGKIIYSTPEFIRLKKELIKNIPSKNKLKKHIKKKDKFELEGYFKEIRGFDITKGLFLHIRRKLQIVIFLTKKRIIPNYVSCINKIKFRENEKGKLIKLLKAYQDRKSLSKKDKRYYYNFAKKLTDKIMQL